MKVVFYLFAALGHLFWARWLLTRFPRLRAKKRWLYAAALILSAISPVFRNLDVANSTKALVLAMSAIELSTISLSVVLLGAFMLVTRAAQFLPGALLGKKNAEAPLPLEISEDTKAAEAVTEGLVSKHEINVAPSAANEAKPNTARETITRREALERFGGIAALAGTGSVLGWGMVRGRHAFEVMEVAVKIVGLPKALDGYTIAQVSDIHVGTFVQERELGEGLSLLSRIRPDLIVATGDLVDYDPSFIPLMARTLGDLRARDGIVAILGNHDYYTQASLITGALRQSGVRVLINDALHLREDDGGGFALLGVDDFMGQRMGGSGGPRLDRAIAKAPKDRARILLAHQPRFFEEAAGQVALQLSGHTHGGQINPGVTPANLFMEFVKGRYERSESTLWVNRGFGTAGPPSRVGAPPEVTKIVLVAA